MTLAHHAPALALLATLTACTVLLLREDHRGRHRPGHGRTRPHSTHVGTAQHDRDAIKEHDMPAHPRAYQRIADQLAATTDPKRRNELLDEWIEICDQATEWDARRWGFDPDRWCEIERAAMNRRAAIEEPTR